MKLVHTQPNKGAVPGFWDIKDLPQINGEQIVSRQIGQGITVLDNVLTDETCDNLIKLFNESGISAPVSVSGVEDGNNYGVGSVRATGWSTLFADRLTELMIPYLPNLKCDDFTATDWWQNSNRDKVGLNEDRYHKWNPIEISPLLRFMKYQKDSEHFAHYDAGFFYPDGIHRTLQSVVIYLTDNNSGATRFIQDNQDRLPIWEREHSDWIKRVDMGDVKYQVYPKKGSVLIFNHRLCHDVEQFNGLDGDRIIIRGDVIYRGVK